MLSGPRHACLLLAVVLPACGPVLMKVGTQHSTDEDTLNACSSFGVKNICSDLPSRKFDEKWSVEALTRLRGPRPAREAMPCCALWIQR